MLFNEKLYKLRKEKNLSQEELAEKLDTTRQAVSKWENGQGFPETEKLLQISNVFEVSVDYLLKDTQDEASNAEKGYYVSREMAEGYLAHEKARMKKILFGVVVLILSLLPLLRSYYGGTNPLLLIMMVLFGSFWLLRGLTAAGDAYKVLKRESLIFDTKYLSELKTKAERIVRKAKPALIAALLLTLLCVYALAFTVRAARFNFMTKIPAQAAMTVAALALSLSVSLYFGALLKRYQLLAKNDERVQGFWFRLFRKAKKKMDERLK